MRFTPESVATNRSPPLLPIWTSPGPTLGIDMSVMRQPCEAVVSGWRCRSSARNSFTSARSLATSSARLPENLSTGRCLDSLEGELGDLLAALTRRRCDGDPDDAAQPGLLAVPVVVQEDPRRVAQAVGREGWLLSQRDGDLIHPERARSVRGPVG